MSSKNNVNPDHYKAGGSLRQGEAVVQGAQLRKRTGKAAIPAPGAGPGRSNGHFLMSRQGALHDRPDLPAAVEVGFEGAPPLPQSEAVGNRVDRTLEQKPRAQK
jgi:hypothetical protein